MVLTVTKETGLFLSDSSIIFVFICNYNDREIPKNAGFRWNAEKKRWWTDDKAKAGILRRYADATCQGFLDHIALPAPKPITLSPAHKWDHLPERERYRKILRMDAIELTKNNVASQFRKMSLIFHSDKTTELDEIFRELGNEMFLQVMKAKEYFERSL
jgi:hypothetical protein